jgi:glycerophosphoryl diester phosphodiesterase
MKDPMHPSVVVHGHRGARGFYPENTLPAFAYAAKLGVDFLELDVVCTGDMEILISHDPFMHHTICLTPEGEEILEKNETDHNIFKKTTSEVQRYRCGEKKHPRFPDQLLLPTYKPLLKELVADMKNYGMSVLPKLNIEVKSQEVWDNKLHPEPKEYARLVYQTLQELNLTRSCVIQCFDYRILTELHLLDAGMNYVYLIEFPIKHINSTIAALPFLPNGLSLHHSLINAGIVDFCQREKLVLSAWTVNEEKDISAMLALGVEGIISDYPDRVLRLIGR